MGAGGIPIESELSVDATTAYVTPATTSAGEENVTSKEPAVDGTAMGLTDSDAKAGAAVGTPPLVSRISTKSCLSGSCTLAMYSATLTKVPETPAVKVCARGDVEETVTPIPRGLVTVADWSS